MTGSTERSYSVELEVDVEGKIEKKVANCFVVHGSRASM